MRKDDERLAVPTPGGDALSEVPVKAERKHIVLFVVACVLLAGTLSSLIGFAELRMQPAPPSGSVESQLPGGEILAGALVAAAYALAEVMTVGGFAVCWVGGGVISVLLAIDRKNKPRWLWVASLVLATAHVAALAVMMGVWFLL